MPLRIQDIQAQHLGPLESVSIRPGLFTCVYGRNEKGKTFLVEFLVRSLFRNAKDWRLRSAKGAGRVTVSGLGTAPVAFSPGSGKKLEDFWVEQSLELPPDFSRLLVVKGAELELLREEWDVNRKVLKSFLSAADVLDKIQNRISKTLQSARIENGIPVGKKIGEFEERIRLEKQLQDIDTLFAQLDKGYSGGRRALLTETRARLERDIADQELAKRHEAFKIDASIRLFEKKRDAIDDEALKSLRQQLHHWAKKSEDIRRKRTEQETAEMHSLHFEWLRSARDQYHDLINRKAVRARPILLVIGLALSAASAVCIVLRLTAPALLTLIAGTALVFWHMRLLHAAADHALGDEELNGLKSEFRVRLHQELAGLAHLDECIRKQETDFNESRVLKKQLADDARELADLEAEIRSGFSRLDLDGADAKTWNASVRQMEDRCKILSEEINDRRIAFARLGIAPEDTVAEPTGAEYDERLLADLRRRSAEVQRDLEEGVRKLDQLKQMICAKTEDGIATEWPSLIQNLRNMREQVVSNYRDQTAQILGKIALNGVLESMRKSEDAKIEEGVNSPEVLSALEGLTRRYRGFRLEGDTLYVLDAVHEFPVSDLSTGAQEQTLLSLRIGFAARLLRQDELFLILDDAFQYSDWERRRHMVDTMVRLAKSGWQILYFTMDDHLLELFDDRGGEFGKDYVRVVL
jgi:hypothetical protein